METNNFQLVNNETKLELLIVLTRLTENLSGGFSDNEFLTKVTALQKEILSSLLETSGNWFLSKVMDSIVDDVVGYTDSIKYDNTYGD